jgi:hypothetical protein
MSGTSSQGSVGRIEIPSPGEIVSQGDCPSGSSLTEIAFAQIVIPKRLMDLLFAHTFIELGFLHLLKSSLRTPFFSLITDGSYFSIRLPSQRDSWI